MTNEPTDQPTTQGIAQEVFSRLTAAGARGRAVTLKIKRRQAGAPEPRKFLGHGICDSASRSVTCGRWLGSAEEVAREAAGLLSAMGIPAEELRGLGITVRLGVRVWWGGGLSLDRTPPP
jgi:DNA repair protein REV1